MQFISIFFIFYFYTVGFRSISTPVISVLQYRLMFHLNGFLGQPTKQGTSKLRHTSMLLLFIYFLLFFGKKISSDFFWSISVWIQYVFLIQIELKTEVSSSVSFVKDKLWYNLQPSLGRSGSSLFFRDGFGLVTSNSAKIPIPDKVRYLGLCLRPSVHVITA